MAKRHRIKDISAIAITVASAIIAFIIGYTIGYAQMLDTCTDIGIKFADNFNIGINKTLIIEYLHRTGL